MVSGFLSGELAKRAGVSPDTLRHYERKGLLAAPPRSANGYRRYPTDALTRIRLIRGALALGFTIDELARVLRVRDCGGLPCRQVRDIARAKLVQLQQRRRELARLCRTLQALLSQWDRQLATTPSGEKAGLLYNLANVQPSVANQLSPPRFPVLGHKLNRRG